MDDRKFFVDVRQTRQGQLFDLYREARPGELFPRDKYLNRVTLDRNLDYEGIGIALASCVPMDTSVVVEIRKSMDVDDQSDSDCG